MEETPAIADDVFNCWDGGDDDSDYHNSYYDSENNENSFPSFHLSSDPQVEDSNGNGSSGDHEQKSIGVGVQSEEDSFASDFYRGGTDWSCLLQIGDEDEKKKKRLKQTNLFQMWGFHKMNPATKSDDNAAAASSSCLHLNKTKKSEKGLVVGSGNGNNSSVSLGVARGSRNKGTTGSEVADQHFRRVCPFYKKLPGTPFTVDAFRYGHVKGCSAYFLSHFHADHYGGLSKGWSHGTIYCTPLTARLVRMHLSVNPSFIRPLELGTENVIEGIKVTMLEANHCPGAALIHFRLPNGQCYLHTGDFRASKLMQAYPLLSNRRINVLYLDTTYCNPKYRFPSKEEVLNFVVRVTKSCMKKQPSILVVVGAYSIGKECVYLAISKALGLKIYANPSRRRTLQSFGWPEISGNLSMHGKDTPLHVLPISSLRFEILERYLKTYKSQYTAILAFRPTGWTYSETIGSQLDLIKPSSKGTVTIYGVPYSEHSSFTELREFVQFLRPEKIIPTVNVGSAANRDKMQSYFREWMKG